MPNYNQIYNANTYLASTTYVQGITEAAYALDTLKFNDQWQLLLGGRLDEFNANISQQNYNNPLTNTGASTISIKHDDFMPSYRVGLVYKPVINGTIYSDAGTSFNPSAESLSLSTSFVNLKPEQTTTQEIGTKWDFFDARLSTQASVYHSEQTNVRETDPKQSGPDDPGRRRQGGRGRGAGDRTHHRPVVQAITGYAYTFSVIDKSPTQGIASDLGHRLANAPMHTFNLWTGYTFPFKLEIGAGTNYVSSRSSSGDHADLRGRRAILEGIARLLGCSTPWPNIR